VLAVALEVDAFVNIRATEDEVTSSRPLLEPQPTQEVAKIVERDRSVRGAPEDPFEEKLRARHRSIVPRLPLEAMFGLTFR
jgi:hypothetical protein